MNRKMKAIALAPVAILALAGCSSYDNDVSEQSVQQRGYVLFPADRDVVGCKGEGETGYAGPGEDFYRYPAGERTYDFGTENAEGPAVKVNVDNVEVTLVGKVSFYLTDDCEALGAFHKEIGTKQWGGSPAYINDGFAGWDNMLDTYIGSPNNVAVSQAVARNNAEVKKADPKNVVYVSYANKSGLPNLSDIATEEFNKAFRSQFPQAKDYFKNVRVTVSDAALPESVVAKLAAFEEARLDNAAQEQKNATVLTELNTLDDIASKVGQDNVVDYLRNKTLDKAVDSGKVSVWVVPSDSKAVVSAPAAQ